MCTTFFNLLIGLNGCTIYSDILNHNLNGDSIIAIPPETKESMEIGWISDPKFYLSGFTQRYLEELYKLTRQ